MYNLILKKISFGSFVKIFTLGGLGFGVFIGILMLVIALCGGPVTATFGTTVYSGMVAGVLGLISCPIAGAFAFLWFSIFLYPFFTLILRIVRGINIRALILPQAQPGYDPAPEWTDAA